ncbi:lipopolysaccharide biosynthesis protein [Fischerella thermalis WC559]|jgi:succinoglycan biosynthesis transport protein ExoP|uniref:GumC family protein n=1 Tax=Fischerella thermalis TaxID=372787 RepID=UPI0002ECAC51|nr:polysaccharide biosynthesis tyrosine autokinase [Fischerella thermalis]PLZ07064.1 lipopolysaccharide biosynthesis protein [Fischerella thermalis WC114]PLZ11383.1 lipopolysaccharide biosynthesis protein [Fischerella thermalis WC119]PLZ13275.1 lipopolysaccharide biosynthesis protein [Fischerella thermalis WC1110]PLZ17404.1 lipopolysaccharide biosynthesis protein [Fischerella thermalis WC157]PLZ27205.1 lipopolysaccharide biosynthesis protein [Fischerella thermalis WC559]
MENNSYTQATEIQQYLLILKRRWRLITTIILASIGLSGSALFMQKPEYQADGILLFKSDRTSSLTKVGEKIGDLEALMREGNPLETQAVIVNSHPMLQEVITALQLKDDQGKLIDPELLKVNVKPIVGTDVLRVSYASNDRELAAAVVNQLMKSYVENNIQTNRAQVSAAGEFIKEQLPASRQELERAAEALRQFKIQNKVIQLAEESTAAIDIISKLDQEINQVKAALADVSAQEQQIASQLNVSENQAVTVTSLSQIPGVQEVLTELQKVQTKLANARAIYTEVHPTITDLKNQQATLNSLLQQRTQEYSGIPIVSPGKLQIGKIREELTDKYVEFKAERQGLEKKIRTLSNIRANYQQQLAMMPSLEKKQQALERRLEAAKTGYENLVTRLQEIQVAEKQTIGNARIVQPAQIPKKPVISKTKILLAGGSIFAGVLLSIAAAFFVDLIDRSLKTVKETETFFGYTLLGLIPKYKLNNSVSGVQEIETGVYPQVITTTSPRTVVHEAYQMLQANLKFISHRKVRKIVVTSSVTAEGKSEVSANLAAVIAQSGKRVLLVDADMRKPTQHHLWGLINSVGLSHLLVDQGVFSQAVQKVTEFLAVLTAGVIPPNPLALIDSEGMTSLVDIFAENYDYVIFDTPPLAGIADAAVLGKMADGILLVTRPGVLDAPSAAAAKSLLERSEANVLGIVANAVNAKQEPSSYFYYSNLRDRNSTADLERVPQQLK